MADSLKRKIGYAMLATPFVGIVIFSSFTVGFLPTLGVVGGVGLGVVWLCIAADLVS